MIHHDELDRLMAEKCMGWHLEEAYVEGVETQIWSHREQSGVLGYSYEVPGYWHPTTDIAQAMQCAEEYGRLALRQLDTKEWEADFYPWEHESKANTPALAICMAIAKALEGK